MMHQSYRNFHLFVAVKGMSSFIFQSILIPQFQEFIDEGRLTLRWFPNKNQLSNLADTIRGLDTTNYELFLKIDDDDFYGRDYLLTINEFHSEIPQHHCSCFKDWSWVHYKYGGISSLQKEFYYVFGASMVLTRSVMERLMACEEHPEMIHPIVQRWDHIPGHGNIGFSEDNFIHKLMLETGIATSRLLSPRRRSPTISSCRRPMLPSRGDTCWTEHSRKPTRTFPMMLILLNMFSVSGIRNGVTPSGFWNMRQQGKQ